LLYQLSYALKAVAAIAAGNDAADGDTRPISDRV
jgi:hypothetical protein